MAIEFPCTGCKQTLRVAEESAGKSARCPQCNVISPVPLSSVPAATPGSPFGSTSSPAAPSKPAWEFSDAAPGLPGSSFAGGAIANPYASPSANAYAGQAIVAIDGPIVPQVVGIDPIFNHAWQVWKNNLGILVGVTVMITVISYVFSFGSAMVQIPLQQNGEHEAAAVVNLAFVLISNVVQIFLGIGQAQIALKLARGQRADFGELFNGGSRFLPVLGASILGGLAIGVGFALLIIPGIILLLMWWPFYYLVVDNKAGVTESFGLASRITKGNWGTAFILWLASIAIMIVGFLALCVGILFAAPLVTMLWAVAYLMMSGQVSAYPQMQQPKWLAP